MLPFRSWVLNLQQRHYYESLVPKSDRDDESNISVSPAVLPRSSLFYQVIWVFPWVLCIILSTALFAVSSDHRRTHRHGSYESGFDTDLALANPSLGLTKVKFYGSIQIDANGTYYLTHNPDEPNFVGPSSPEIDEAWENMLLYKRYLGLTPEEAAETDFEIGEKDWLFNLYWISPSTFHTLHCLNYIRMSLDREYYTKIQNLPPKPFRMTHRMHLDHCIEALRQTVQCSLDMTPVPRLWIPLAEMYRSDIDQWHTCRDFGAVREWIDWRNRDEKVTRLFNVTH